MAIALLMLAESPLFDRVATASVIASEAELWVGVNVTNSGGNVVSRQATLPSEEPVSVFVSDALPGRSAASGAEAILTGDTGGSVSFTGSFQKSPGQFLGGFTYTRGSLTYRFETDAATTLFVEAANAAILGGDGELGTIDVCAANEPPLALRLRLFPT